MLSDPLVKNDHNLSMQNKRKNSQASNSSSYDEVSKPKKTSRPLVEDMSSILKESELDESLENPMDSSEILKSIPKPSNTPVSTHKEKVIIFFHNSHLTANFEQEIRSYS